MHKKLLIITFYLLSITSITYGQSLFPSVLIQRLDTGRVHTCDTIRNRIFIFNDSTFSAFHDTLLINYPNQATNFNATCTHPSFIVQHDSLGFSRLIFSTHADTIIIDYKYYVPCNVIRDDRSASNITFIDSVSVLRDYTSIIPNFNAFRNLSIPINYANLYIIPTSPPFAHLSYSSTVGEHMNRTLLLESSGTAGTNFDGFINFTDQITNGCDMFEIDSVVVEIINPILLSRTRIFEIAFSPAILPSSIPLIPSVFVHLNRLQGEFIEIREAIHIITDTFNTCIDNCPSDRIQSRLSVFYGCDSSNLCKSLQTDAFIYRGSRRPIIKDTLFTSLGNWDLACFRNPVFSSMPAASELITHKHVIKNTGLSTAFDFNVILRSVNATSEVVLKSWVDAKYNGMIVAPNIIKYYYDPVLRVDSIMPTCVNSFRNLDTTSEADNYSPIFNMSWRVPILNPGDSFVINFDSYRCCPSDLDRYVGNLNGVEYFDTWTVNGYLDSIDNATQRNIARDECGNIIRLVPYSNRGIYEADIDVSAIMGPAHLTGENGTCNDSLTVYYDLPITAFCDGISIARNEALLASYPNGALSGRLVVEVITDHGLNPATAPTNYVYIEGSLLSGLDLRFASSVSSSYGLGGGMSRVEFDLDSLHGDASGSTYENLLYYLNNSYLRFPITPCCNGLPTPKITVRLYLIPLRDSSGSCVQCEIPIGTASRTIQLHCPGCVTPGVIVDNCKVQRETVGYPDINNNGLADTRYPYANINEITRNRYAGKFYMPGDEISMSFDGFGQDGDDADTGFSYATLRNYWQSIHDTNSSYPTRFTSLYVLVRNACADATAFNWQVQTDTLTWTRPGGLSGMSLLSPYLIHSGSYLFYRIPLSAIGDSITTDDHYKVKLRLKACRNGSPMDCDISTYMWWSADDTMPYNAFDRILTAGEVNALYSDSLEDLRLSKMSPFYIYLCEANGDRVIAFGLKRLYNSQWFNSGNDEFPNSISCDKKLVNSYNIKVITQDPLLKNLFPFEYRPIPLDFLYDMYLLPSSVSPSYALDNISSRSTYMNWLLPRTFAVDNSIVGSTTRIGQFNQYQIPDSICLVLDSSPPTAALSSFVHGDEYNDIEITYQFEPTICGLPDSFIFIRTDTNRAIIQYSYCVGDTVQDTIKENFPYYKLTNPNPNIQLRLTSGPVTAYSVDRNCFTVRLNNNSFSNQLAENLWLHALQPNLGGEISSISINSSSVGVDTTSIISDGDSGFIVAVNHLLRDEYIDFDICFDVNSCVAPDIIKLIYGYSCIDSVNCFSDTLDINLQKAEIQIIHYMKDSSITINRCSPSDTVECTFRVLNVGEIDNLQTGIIVPLGVRVIGLNTIYRVYGAPGSPSTILGVESSSVTVIGGLVHNINQYYTDTALHGTPSTARSELEITMRFSLGSCVGNSFNPIMYLRGIGYCDNIVSDTANELIVNIDTSSTYCPAVNIELDSIIQLQCINEHDASIRIIRSSIYDSIVGGIHYTWNTGDTGIFIDSLGAGTYTVIATDGYGCADTQSFTIVNPSVLIPHPIIFSSFASCIIPIDPEDPTPPEPSTCLNACDSSIITYYTNYTSGYTYTWHVTGAISYVEDEDSVSVYWGNMGTGTITVITTSERGCIDSAVSCVEIKQCPRAYFTTNPDSADYVYICLGTDVIFTDSSFITEDMGVVTYSWNFGDGTLTSGTTNEIITHSYLNTGVYAVSLIVKSECGCSDTFIKTVEVAFLPGVVIECPSVICANDTGEYYTLSLCSYGYDWSVTGGTIVDAVYDNSIRVAWGNPSGGFGTVSLSGINCDDVCRASTTIIVPIVSDAISIVGATITCVNKIEEYTMPNWPGTVFYWTINDGTTVYYDQGHTIEWNMPNFETNIEMTVSYYDSLIGCGGSDTIIIHVIPSINIVGDRKICNNRNFSYEVESLSSGTPILWNLVNSLDSIIDTYTGPTYTGVWNHGLGVFYLSASDVSGTNYCGETKIKLIVTEVPNAISSIETVEPVCPNSVETYSAFIYDEDTYLNWIVEGGTLISTGSNQAVVQWGGSSPYRLGVVALSSDEPHCPSDTFWQIIPEYIPEPPTYVGPDTVCVNSFATYDFTTVGITSYDWSISSNVLGSIANGQGTGVADINWNNTPGTATLSITLHYCNIQLTAYMSIYILPIPIPSIATPTSICQYHTATFTVNDVATSSAMTVASAYNWDFGDGVQVVTTSPTVDHVYNRAGNFTVSVVVVDPASCGGNALDNELVTVLPTPDLYISTPDSVTYYHCPGYPTRTVSTTLYGTLVAGTGSGGAVTWSWYFKSVGSTSFTALPATTANITLTSLPIIAGDYYLEVTDDNGCSNTSNIIHIDLHCETYPPDCTPATAADVSYTQNCLEAYLSGIVTDPSEGTCIGWVVEDPFQGNRNYTGSSVSHRFNHSGYFRSWANFSIHDLGTSPPEYCNVQRELIVKVPLHDSLDFDIRCGSGSTDYMVYLYDRSDYLASYTLFSRNWQILDASSGVVATSTDANPIISTILPGSYTISLTMNVVEGGVHEICTITSPLVIPTRGMASFIVDDDVVCEGTPVSFTYTGTVPVSDIVFYSWDFGDGAGNNNGPSNLRTYKWEGILDPNLPDLYAPILTITDKYACNYSSDGSNVVTIFENRLRGEVGPQYPIICPDEDTLIRFAVPLFTLPPTTYQWSNGATTPTITTNLAGFYSVTVSDAQCSFYDGNYSKVTVVPINNIRIRGEHAYCEGDELDLYSTSNPTQICTWYIYSASHTLITNFIGPRCNIIASADMAFVQLRITDPATGCDFITTDYPIIVFARPAAPIINPPSLCFPPSSLLIATTTLTGPYSINWNTGQIGDRIYTNSARTYSAIVIDEHGCASLASNSISHPFPDFSSLMSGCFQICDTSLPLSIPGISGDFDSYSWLVNGVVESSASGGSIYFIPSLFLNRAVGTYNIQLVATTTYGCIDTSSNLEITITACKTCPLSFEQDLIICIEDSASISFQYSVHNDDPVHNAEIINITSIDAILHSHAIGSIPASSTFILDGTLLPLPGKTEVCLNIISRFMGVDSTWDTCSNLACFEVPLCIDSCSLQFSNPTQIACAHLNGQRIFVFNTDIRYLSASSATYSWSNNLGYSMFSSGISPYYLTPSGTSTTAATFTIVVPEDSTLDNICINLVAVDTLIGDTCMSEFCYLFLDTSKCSPCNLGAVINGSKIECTDTFGKLSFEIEMSVAYSDWNVQILNPAFNLNSGSIIYSGSGMSIFSGTINGFNTDTCLSLIIQFTNLYDPNAIICFDTISICLPRCILVDSNCSGVVSNLIARQVLIGTSVDVALQFKFEYFSTANASWYVSSSTGTVLMGSPSILSPSPIINTIDLLFEDVGNDETICFTLFVYDSIRNTWCIYDTCISPEFYSPWKPSEDCVAKKDLTLIDSCWINTAGLVEHAITYFRITSGSTYQILASFSACGPVEVTASLAPSITPTNYIQVGNNALWIHLVEAFTCDPICITIYLRDTISDELCVLNLCVDNSCSLSTVSSLKLARPITETNVIQNSLRLIEPLPMQISLIPNPTNNSSSLHFQFNDEDEIHIVRILSMQGEEVKKIKLYEINGKIELDARQYAKGIYMVQIGSASQAIKTYKWVISD